MIPKQVRNVLYLLILIGVGYWSFNVLRLHTRQEVIAFKTYSSALMDGNQRKARKLVLNKSALEPFEKRKKRGESLRGEVRITYYKIRSIRRGKKGRTANLEIRQVIRLDPPGSDTLFGTEVVFNNQRVSMVQKESQWMIEKYSDSFYSPGMKE
jgi:hypothetical protein